jgi:hypothetical protein
MGIGLCGRGPWRTLRAILSVSAIAVPKPGNKIHCELRLPGQHTERANDEYYVFPTHPAVFAEKFFNKLIF